ncbi:putative BZIP transcription factor [Seiridium cardinale]
MDGSPSKPAKSTRPTRKVIVLTPAQLARKRENDRDAQRALRARTKEHLRNLERELEELRSTQNRDPIVQELLTMNKQLEEELRTLKESIRRISGEVPSSCEPSYHDPGSYEVSESPRTSKNTDANVPNSGNSNRSAAPYPHQWAAPSPYPTGTIDSLSSTPVPSLGRSYLDSQSLAPYVTPSELPYINNYTWHQTS